MHPSPSPSVFQSPWYWMLVFGTVAWLGIWAISGKFQKREQVLEQKMLGRQTANERVARGEAIDPRAQAAPDNIEKSSSSNATRPAEQRSIEQWHIPDGDDNAKTLGFVQVIMLIVGFVGLGGVIWEQVKRGRASTAEVKSQV
jgi:hypothetical protein